MWRASSYRGSADSVGVSRCPFRPEPAGRRGCGRGRWARGWPAAHTPRGIFVIWGMDLWTRGRAVRNGARRRSAACAACWWWWRIRTTSRLVWVHCWTGSPSAGFRSLSCVSLMARRPHCTMGPANWRRYALGSCASRRRCWAWTGLSCSTTGMAGWRAHQLPSWPGMCGG